MTDYKYMQGFGGNSSTEALEGALPPRGHTPQLCPYGTYAEQINCTAFTKPRHQNFRSWVYRVRPSADMGEFEKPAAALPLEEEAKHNVPNQIRWMPMPIPAAGAPKVTFVEGMRKYCGAGDAQMRGGLSVYLYACNADMVDQSFASADGEMLIVPQEGTLDITTEMGKMHVPSNWICVIPRGIKFSVKVPASGARGYICEVFNSSYELPPLGAIGANGLSNARDFQKPVACFEDRECAWTHFQMFNGELFQHTIGHSPFDVVAWHGTCSPYRYNLADFCTINSVSFDHIDPSIFCVLTAQTAEPGVAVCDFVIFPPRYMVQADTFRPPYYHRNVMCEFMGNIRGVYEAKTDGNFLPGGATLHNTMAPHGPSADVFQKGSTAELKALPPAEAHQSIMFESYYSMKLTDYSKANNRDMKYMDVWKGLAKNFDATKK
jgi:homogentisate 1,2-dioxygenase